MYSDENYLWGLVAYYVGSGLVLLFLWRFRELLPGRHFRNVLLLLITATLLVPISASPDLDYLAPAWFVSLYEGLTSASEQGYLRGALPILVCFFAALLVYTGGQLIASQLVRSSRTADHDTTT